MTIVMQNAVNGSNAKDGAGTGKPAPVGDNNRAGASTKPMGMPERIIRTSGMIAIAGVFLGIGIAVAQALSPLLDWLIAVPLVRLLGLTF